LFRYLQLQGSNTEEQGKAFLEKALSNPGWAQENIMSFLSYHKDRVVNKKEISPTTLSSLKAPIKLFLEMNDFNKYDISTGHVSLNHYPRLDKLQMIERLQSKSCNS
jgi:hypothetical protein